MLVRFCLLVTVALAPLAPLAADAEDAFPRPEQLEPAIEFWTRVYTEVDTRGGFIHDSRHLDIVYETVRDAPSDAVRRRRVRAAVERYRAILNKLGSGAREGLSAEERRVLELFPEGTSNGELREAAGRLRFQLGQADRFKAGLVRSGVWRNYIQRALAEHDVPRALVALPHVESSFDPTAYSKAGAAGMWQFTRSTGLRYLRIDHIVDERRDPFMSTNAAARLLRDNYEVLGHWPLAITAYNHGVGGMRRAVRQLGSTDMGVIAERYRSRTFGFASRNFYAAFLAASDVDANPEKHFGPVDFSAPSDSIVTPVPDYVEARSIARELGIEPSLLRSLNPALSEMVWSGDKFVPKGFALRIPGSVAARDPRQLLAALPASERYAAQQPDVEHRVARGETLSQIAARYRVSLGSLVRINSLRSSHFIRVGQVLKLPVPADATPATLAEASGEYVVRRGDTIEQIARRLDVDAKQLLSANDIRNRNLIYAGQRLRVPGAADAAESIAAQARQAVLADAADGTRQPGVPDIPAIAEPDTGTTDSGAAAQRSGTAPEPDLAAAESGAALAAAEAVDGDAPVETATLVVGPPVPESLSDESAPAETDQANVLASHQAALAADPSDYSVSNGRISVQALETLGHFADWLEIRTQRLRDLNGMPFGKAVVIGQSLRLDFARVTPEEFERRRFAYHERRQEAFFSSYQIAEVEDHVIRRGESLWVLAQREYDVPVWLVRQYNPDLDPDRVAPGTVVKFPRLRPITSDDDQVST